MVLSRPFSSAFAASHSLAPRVICYNRHEGELETRTKRAKSGREAEEEDDDEDEGERK